MTNAVTASAMAAMRGEEGPTITIEPLRYNATEADLHDLRQRLARTRWPDALPETDWDLGVDVNAIRELATYWQAEFDWRTQEAEIARFPHHLAEIDGQEIHFIQQRGVGPDPLPLIVTHGWPSSFLEMLPLISLLADPAAHGGDPADAFDVIVPSLPGFGFSGRPAGPGMDEARIAALWSRLMTEGLGYERFGAHGGDIGAKVSQHLAAAQPERVAGAHLIQDADWGPAEGAYAFLQATKPQTLAVGLTDSPAGQLAWIAEKFRAWSDSGGDLLSRFSADALLANATLYLLTETIGSSVRLYAGGEFAAWGDPGPVVTVPAGFALVGWSGGPPPEEADARAFSDVRRVTRMPRGGHFLAGEEPALLAEELRAFFRPLRASGG